MLFDPYDKDLAEICQLVTREFTSAGMTAAESRTMVRDTPDFHEGMILLSVLYARAKGEVPPLRTFARVRPRNGGTAKAVINPIGTNAEVTSPQTVQEIVLRFEEPLTGHWLISLRESYGNGKIWFLASDFESVD